MRLAPFSLACLLPTACQFSAGLALPGTAPPAAARPAGPAPGAAAPPGPAAPPVVDATVDEVAGRPPRQRYQPPRGPTVACDRALDHCLPPDTWFRRVAGDDVEPVLRYGDSFWSYRQGERLTTGEFYRTVPAPDDLAVGDRVVYFRSGVDVPRGVSPALSGPWHVGAVSKVEPALARFDVDLRTRRPLETARVIVEQRGP